MHLSQRAPLVLAAVVLLVSLTGAATAQDSSVTLVKTVGTDPNACATEPILPEPPPDGVVYYCYKMTYTGAISASCHTLVDSVLGNVLDNIPGFRCCTNASGADCASPLDACNPNSSDCGGMYPVCAATTFPGVCCADLEGLNCDFPHRGCEDDSNCGSDHCVTEPIVADGQTVTRVITATVQQNNIANTATWTAQAGICCSDTDPDACDGSEFEDAPLCATNDDCFGTQTCRKEGIGLCCNPSDPTSCDAERVCLAGRDCELSDPNTPDAFTECIPLDTSASAEAGARVGVVDTPALSAGALAVSILMLVGIGFSRLRRQTAHG